MNHNLFADFLAESEVSIHVNTSTDGNKDETKPSEPQVDEQNQQTPPEVGTLPTETNEDADQSANPVPPAGQGQFRVSDIRGFRLLDELMEGEQQPQQPAQAPAPAAPPQDPNQAPAAPAPAPADPNAQPPADPNAAPVDPNGAPQPTPPSTPAPTAPQDPNAVTPPAQDPNAQQPQPQQQPAPNASMIYRNYKKVVHNALYNAKNRPPEMAAFLEEQGATDVHIHISTDNKESEQTPPPEVGAPAPTPAPADPNAAPAAPEATPAAPSQPAPEAPGMRDGLMKFLTDGI